MSLIPWAPSQWTDDLGRPLAFGQLYLYQAGTLIPKAAYQDAAHTVAHTFPITLDATGRANVWLIDGEAYDLVVHDANGNTLRSVLGIVTNAAPSPSPGGGGTFELVSISEGMTLIADLDDLHWFPAGCFCWIIPAEGLSRVKYLKTVNPGGTQRPAGKFAVFGLPSSDAAGAKLYEGSTPMHFEAMDLDVSSYPFVGVAMDPLPWGVPEPVKQTRFFVPEITANGIANNFHYIGAHTHDTPFTTFPAIIANDPAYYFARWMALGVTCE